MGMTYLSAISALEPSYSSDSNVAFFSSLGFWYGGQLILSGESAPGNILTVFFSVVIGTVISNTRAV
jgi:hypothetical protein